LTEAKPFLDSLWWAAVTALTVGNGDITPVTPLGRTIGVLFGHFWIFMIIPMIIANILMHLVDDRNAFTHEEQIELMILPPHNRTRPMRYVPVARRLGPSVVDDV